MAAAATIQVKSKEGDVFTMEVEVARKSPVLGQMMDLLGIKGDDGAPEGAAPIPLDPVPSRAMRNIIKWGNYHKIESEPDTMGNKYVSKFDEKMLRGLELAALAELTTAAFFLDIKRLCDACVITTAKIMPGKSAEECYVLLGVRGNLPFELRID